MMDKMTHKAANYRPAVSTVQRCGTCSMYRDSSAPSCTLVVKPIRPTMICDYFEKRKTPIRALEKA